MRRDHGAAIRIRQEEMLRDLAALVACRSTASEPEEGAPFGRGAADALNTMLSMAQRDGFSCGSVDGQAGYIDFGTGEDSGMFGILCHLDVVPAGDGWTGDPFTMREEKGVLYGRGVQDDKGPAMAAYYAMKALREAGVVPKGRVRLILGLNEETGEESIAYYREHERIPDFSIVPDSDFPVVHGEKGIMTLQLIRRLGPHSNDGCRICWIRGGNAPNMVPDQAEAFLTEIPDLRGLKDHLRSFSNRSGYGISCQEQEEGLLIRAAGISAHGAMPWKGKNAISILLALLQTIPCSSREMTDILRFYESCIGFDFHGERIGLDLEDDLSGQLIFNTGMIEADERELRLTVNLRIPVTKTKEDVLEKLKVPLEQYGMELQLTMYQPPLYVSPEDERIRRLMDIYQQCTGDTESEPLVIGGGTYARQMEHAVAFGALYPGEEDSMHQKDEHVTVEHLMQTARIYAETIRQFACEEAV